MSSHGFFPSLVVPTFRGFVGPKKKTAVGTLLTVTQATQAASTNFGTVAGISTNAFNTQIFAVHTMLVPDPGSNVGSVSPSAISGFNIVGVLNLKVGSPINGYIVFSGAFSVPGGVTVTYLDSTSVVRTETPVLTDLSANLGAGFSSWKVAHLFKGTNTGTPNPFTIQFHGV